MRRDVVAAPGEKGLVEGIILALGYGRRVQGRRGLPAGVARRDRTRRIELAWTVDGREERIVLQGTRISRRRVRELRRPGARKAAAARP